MATAQPSVDDYKKQTELATAETAAANAQLTLLEAKKKLADATADPDAAKAATDAKLAASKAATAQLDADKAQFDAAQSLLKSKYAVPDSGISGDVKLGDKAGALEIALLASYATKLVGKEIAHTVQGRLDSSKAARPAAAKPIVVMSTGEQLDFQVSYAYELQRVWMRQTLINAKTMVEAPSTGKDKGGPGTESFAAVGVAVQAMSKILGFFKSDFSVAGADVASDDTLLAQAVAENLMGCEIYFPGIYMPLATDGTGLQKSLEDIKPNYDDLVTARERLKREARELGLASALNKNASEADKQAKIKSDFDLKIVEEKIAMLTTVMGAYETFVARLYGADGAAAFISRQLVLKEKLALPGARLLHVKMNKAGGESYIEKNLWTSFGAMPYKVAGGIVASYALIDSATGAVAVSGTVVKHGGFSKANLVGEYIAGGQP